MELSYNDVLNAWKNFLLAASGNITFDHMMTKLTQIFSNHYHSVKYDSEQMVYMESLHNMAYMFTYDLILKDDKRFKQQKGGDIQIEILVNMVNINNHKKTTIDAIDFIHKYCNPDCRAILEKGTIEFL